MFLVMSTKLKRNIVSRISIIIIGSLLLAYSTASAGWAPKQVCDSLKSLYPNVETVAWSTDQSYYVAGFTANGFDTQVWFDTQGHWVMKQTDWQTMDQVPMPVYHTFTFGPYSTDQVDNVTYVEFPHNPPQIVILISLPNALTQYQLFYTMQGELFNARNTTNMYHILGASTFL